MVHILYYQSIKNSKSLTYSFPTQSFHWSIIGLQNIPLWSPSDFKEFNLRSVFESRPQWGALSKLFIGQMVTVLASDWSRFITEPEYWPLISQYSDHVTCILASDWPRVFTWPEPCPRPICPIYFDVCCDGPTAINLGKEETGVDI